MFNKLMSWHYEQRKRFLAQQSQRVVFVVGGFPLLFAEGEPESGLLTQAFKGQLNCKRVGMEARGV